MLYWIIFFILLYLMIKEIINNKIYPLTFQIVYIILTLFLCLRKGQGTDYYNYQSIYIGIKEAKSFLESLVISHGEIGFLFLNFLSIKLGLSFQIFMILFSLLMMRIYYPFFNKICNKSIIPLFIFYSTFFLIYAFSGVRQGLALAIILSYAFPLILQKRTKKFCLVVLVAMLFHTSAVVCFAMPFIYKISYQKVIILFIVGIATLFGIIRINLLNYFPMISLAYEAEASGSNSYLALAIRLIAILPVFLISDKLYRNNKQLRCVRNFLIFGYILYCFLSFNDIVSSRLNVYYRIFEGIFVYLLISKTYLKVICKQIAVYYTMISFVVMASNIRGFIQQGEYRGCNFLTYPYFSVFNTTKEIKEYRTDFGAYIPTKKD